MCLHIHVRKHGGLLSLTVSVNNYAVNFLDFVVSLRKTSVICVLSMSSGCLT